MKILKRAAVRFARVAKATKVVKVKVSSYIKRDSSFVELFELKDELCFCTDIKELMKRIDYTSYDPDDWRLFIDTGKQSLKAVLLSNKSKDKSVPIAYSNTLKETYTAVQQVLQQIQYAAHN